MKRLLFNLMILIGLASFSSCGYNSMVEKEEEVSKQWSQVENVYQRRADLIPNLVSTVQGSAAFEKSTLTAVTEARAKAMSTSVNVNPDNLTPENIKKFQDAQDELGGAVARLTSGIKVMMLSENYPQLHTKGFEDLMTELEGTENRIAVERRKFNDVVKDYNTYIRKFPNNMTAGMFGFEKKGYFQSQPGSDKAPKVDFNTK